MAGRRNGRPRVVRSICRDDDAKIFCFCLAEGALNRSPVPVLIAR